MKYISSLSFIVKSSRDGIIDEKTTAFMPHSFYHWLPRTRRQVPETQQANVKLKGNEPCIVYSVKPGDCITSIQIGGEGVDGFSHLFDNKPFYPTDGTCLPTFGYSFKNNKHYVIYYGLDNSVVGRQKLIQANFAIAP